MGPLAKEALRLFYKQFGKRIANTVAENKWIADKIKELSKITQKTADTVRKQLQKETRQIPKEWNKFIHKIVKPIKVPEQTKNLLNIKSTLKGRPVKVVPERPFTGFVPKVVKPKVVKPKLQIDKSKQIIKGMKPKGPKVVNIGDRIIKQMQKEGKTVKFDDLLRIYGKKKPPTLKADGGRIDKALPKKSRDI